MFIYQKIRRLMDELQIDKKSIRIQDMADSIGIVKKSLENYRDGKSQPTVEVLEKIALYFGRDMNYFFDTMKSNDEVAVVTDPKAQYGKSQTDYKLLFEMQKEMNGIIKENADLNKENADLKVENERLKNVNAPDMSANVG